MTEKIQTIISADTHGAQSAFSSFNATVIGLNQGFELMKKALNAVTAPFAAVVKEGSDFTAQMSVVKSISSITAEDFSKLSDEAERIGRTTVFTSTQAGQAMEELRRAGMDVTGVLNTTNDAMNLASAQGYDLAQTSKMVAVQLNIFKSSGLKAKEAVDLMNQTVSSSPMNIEDLNYALQYAAGTASAAGWDFKDLTSVLGAMAEQGQTSTVAGSALSTAMARLMSPTSGAMKALEKYGITLNQINPATNDFADIVDVLNKKNVTQKDLFEILGLRTAPKFFKVIEAGGDSIRNFRKKQDEANGALASAKERLDNLQGDVTLFSSGLSGLKIAIFKSMDSLLRDIVQSATALTNAITEFVHTHQGSFDTFFEKIGEAGNFLIGVFESLIHAVGYVLKAFASILRQASVIDFLNDLWDIAGDVWSIFESVATILFKIGKTVLPPIIEVLGTSLTEIGRLITSVVKPPLKWIADKLKWLSEISFKDVMDDINAFFKRIAEIAADPIGAIKKFKTEVDSLEKPTTVVNSAASELIDTYKRVGATFTVGERVLDYHIEQQKKVGDAIKNTDNVAQALAHGYNYYINQTKKANEESGKLDETLQGNTLTEGFKKVADYADEYGDKLIAVKLTTKNLNDEAKKLDENLDAIANTAQRAAAKLERLHEISAAADRSTANGGSAPQIWSDSNIFEDVFTGTIQRAFEEIDWASIGSVFARTVTNLVTNLYNQISSLVSSSWSRFEAQGIYMENFSTILDEILRPVFEELLPVVAEVGNEFLTVLNELVQEILPPLMELFQVIGEVLVQIIDAVAPIVQNILARVIPLITEIIQELLPSIIEILEGLYPIIDTLLDILIPIIRALIPLIQAINEIIIDLLPLIELILRVVEALLPILLAVINVITILFEALEPLIEAIVSIISPVLEAMLPYIEQLAYLIANTIGAITALPEWLRDTFGPFFEDLMDVMDSLGGLGTGGGISSFFGFAGGTGYVAESQMAHLPGMEPGSGLIKVHRGEQIIPANQTASGSTFSFNVYGGNPEENAEEIRLIIERYMAQGKL